ncbi:MAG: carbohydate-binding domain-containing protein, partial [Flavobacteriaceae bacterium]
MRIIALIIFLSLLGCETDKNKDALEALEIHWEVVSNLEKEGCHARFTFINKSNSELKGQSWALYFNQANVMPRKENNTLGEVIHINGDWFKFSPNPEDFILLPEDTLQFDYFYKDALIKNTDVPLGPYFVVHEDQENERIFEAENFKVKAFNRAEQIHRSKNDFVPIPDSEILYSENEIISELKPGEFSPIVPSPYQIETLEGSLELKKIAGIWADKDFNSEVNYLQNTLVNRFEVSSEFKNEAEA